MRALSRARAATIRAAMRMTPRSVVCRVYHTSRTRTRIWLMTAAVRPGGAGTGTGRRLGDRGPQGGEFCERGLAVHAFALVSVQVCRAAVGDLFEQQVDISSARQRGRTQQLPGCLPLRRRFAHGPGHLHSSSFVPSVRRARNKWLRTAGTVLRVTSATSA